MTSLTLSRVYRPADVLDGADESVTVLGEPVATADAVVFGGSNDGIILGENALSGARKFVIESRFRPLPGGEREQRFFHLQAADSDDRILLEIRLTGDGYWYADSCFCSGESVGILVDPSLRHPLGPWYSYRLSYDGCELMQEIDGVLELSVLLPQATAPRNGVTSIGMRATRNHFFCGEIAEITLHSA